MTAILERVQREPALVVGLVGALIAIALAFGLDLTVEQQGAIMAAVVAILAVVTRQSVTPNVSVAAKVDAAGLVVTGKATPPEGVAAVVDPAHVVIVADRPLPPDEYEGKRRV